MSFPFGRAYRITVLTAGTCGILCSALERSFELEVAAERVALISLAASAATVVLAAVWLKWATVPELRRAIFFTIAIHVASILLKLLLNIGMNVHGVGMATFVFGAMLSFVAVLVLAIGATVKHIRAVN